MISLPKYISVGDLPSSPKRAPVVSSSLTSSSLDGGGESPVPGGGSLLADLSLDSPQSPATSRRNTPSSTPPAAERTLAPRLSIRKPAKPLLTGARSVSEFELGETIGTGSFGRVVLVHLKTEPVRDKARFALKVMKKADVLRLKQVDHIIDEANLLRDLAHPFVVSQVASFQDARRLYLVLEFVPGGELFFVLRRERVITDAATRFYASELVLVYHYLHELGIAYRDLKPENVLLSRTGHIKLADFGFAKVVVGRTFTLCGTPEYLAPEVVQNKGHNQGVDWWALGVLIFECMAGFPPFFDETPLQIYQRIVRGKFDYPAHFEPLARRIITALLASDLSQRLGCMRGGASDVMAHAWFAKTKWQSVLDRLVPAPFFPDADFLNNFDDYSGEEDAEASLPSREEDKLFERFGAWAAPDSPPWPGDAA